MFFVLSSTAVQFSKIWWIIIETGSAIAVVFGAIVKVSEKE